MHNISLLETIAIGLTVAFIGGLVVQRTGLPTIVGYLLAGVAIGPFTPGYLGDTQTINQLAELGIVFLMFGVGLHFSFEDLWRVRNIAILGTLGQMLTMLAIGYGLSQLWGWTPMAGLVLGLALSIASTIVMLRGFMDKGLLNTPHGQVAVGWRVMEDLATVMILLVMPNLVGTATASDLRTIGLALLAALGFLMFMLFAGKRFIPWLLLRVAHTRSRELFILAVLALSLGIALMASDFFGVSLALGAFVAGAVITESPLIHRIASDLLPFREAFSVLFFVSIGMLLDPVYLFDNLQSVLILSSIAIFGKFLVSGLWVMPFPRPARTVLVVAAGSSQIGEFSFILGQTGLSLGFLDKGQYSLIMAGALLSIMFNPVMLWAITPLERGLRIIKPLWKWLDRYGSSCKPIDASLTNHVVVIGYGRIGAHIVGVLRQLHIPFLVIDLNIERLEWLMHNKVPTLLGDTANSDILIHAGLDRARLIVVTLPDETAAELTVAAARDIDSNLPIIARAMTRAGVKRLSKLGAQMVIHPELEGGLQMTRHTLLYLGFSLNDVRRYTDTVRREHYDALVTSQGEHKLLAELLNAADVIDIAWRLIPEDSILHGCTMEEVALHSRTGATVVAIMRDGELLVNPGIDIVFQAGDCIGMLGTVEQIEAAEAFLNAKAPGI